MRKTLMIVLVLFFLAPVAMPHVANAQSEPFIGEIRLFTGNFAPRGWALCDGQLLAIASNTALFSIIGTTYGGDGRTTFALPDLRGRVPIHAGTGVGLTARSLGSQGGEEVNFITESQLPAHTHQAMAHPDTAFTRDPENRVWSRGPSKTNLDRGAATLVPMNKKAIGNTGEDEPVDNMQPFLTLNYISALQGLYPPR